MMTHQEQLAWLRTRAIATASIYPQRSDIYAEIADKLEQMTKWFSDNQVHLAINRIGGFYVVATETLALPVDPPVDEELFDIPLYPLG